MIVEGVNGTRYHLLIHESRAVARNRDGEVRITLKVSGRPVPAATDLRVAAQTDRRVFAWLAGGTAVVAFLLAALTAGNGGPLSSGSGLGSGWRAIESVIAIVLFWGAIIFGVLVFLLSLVRQAQVARELRESKEVFSALPHPEPTVPSTSEMNRDKGPISYRGVVTSVSGSDVVVKVDDGSQRTLRVPEKLNAKVGMPISWTLGSDSRDVPAKR